jgi:hypothetical protein
MTRAIIATLVFPSTLCFLTKQNYKNAENTNFQGVTQGILEKPLRFEALTAVIMKDTVLRIVTL